MKSILITGGAGFVGSSLAIDLRKRLPSARIIALDNLKRRGSELNLPRLRAAGIEFVHGDVRNPEDLDSVGPADALIECSAEPSVLAGRDGSPAYVVNTNLIGTVNCLEWARRCGAGIVFLSTSRVYPIATLNHLSYRIDGDRFALDAVQSLPGASANGIGEAFPLDGPRSLYGATKLCSELLLQEYIDMYGIKGVVNRCGVIAGPWQMGKVDQGVVALWAARHVMGGALSYIGYGGRGHQVRDVLHIHDLAALVLHELEHLDALSGSTFNVGGGLECSASLAELTVLCREISGNEISIASDHANRPGDVPIYITDNATVTAATGWRPRKSTRDILTDVIRWIQENADTLRPILG